MAVIRLPSVFTPMTLTSTTAQEQEEQD